MADGFTPIRAPDISSLQFGIQSLGQSVKERRRLQEEREKQEAFQALAAKAFGGLGAQPVAGQAPTLGAGLPPQQPTQQPTALQAPRRGGSLDQTRQALAQIAVNFPDRFDEVNKGVGLIVEGNEKETARRKQESLDFSFNLQNTPFEQRIPLIQQEAQRLQSLGRDAAEVLELAQMPQENQDKELLARQAAALPAKDRLNFLQGPTPTALQQNLKAAGFVEGTPEFQEELLKQLQKSGQTINIGGSDLTVDQQIELAAKVKRAEKLAEVRAKGVGARESEDIAAGTTASRTVPNLQRSLDLLGEIDTGGIDAVLLKSKQFLGVESANEAELVNAMSKNVIAQLKPVFGAQFTKAEGDWLKAIEAGPTKSTEGNIRLIERGLFLAKKRAETGLQAAITAKDFRTAQEIQDFLEVDLTPQEEQDTTQLTDDELKAELGL